ncbi:MAG: ATP-binding protein [Flexilinea sp.]|nr:ATP-binding protein [Flexilinea sp.]
MKRDLYDKLISWKDSPARKPLVLQGARQVGKTYLVQEFGRNEFEKMIVLNCDKDPRIRQIFEKDFRIERILSDIEILSGQEITAGNTLIFIDEVGEAPRALASLKYFQEDAPQYHVVVAGSLLGLAIHEGVSYPVGKTDEFYLYPLSFPEFVRAKQGEALYERLMTGSLEDLTGLSQLLKDLLREYYFTGGMPEVVREYLAGRPYTDLRNIQKQILADYALDISKHASTAILGRIHQVWNSIPQQLAKRNSKFIYGDIQKGARAKDFELAIEWLLDAGIIYKVPRVRKAGIPLKFYEDFSAFKLYLLDHGLMGAMVDAPISGILLNQNIFEEYDGTFTEQYVYEQLVASLSTGIYYYDSETSKLELDFLTQGQQALLPIEVKAGENLRSKSLKTFHEAYPQSKPIRISLSDYRKQDWLINIPLYAACRIKDF